MYCPNSYYRIVMAKRLRRTETGYLLNKAARQWNALFVEGLRRHGVTDMKPAFGAVLVPLFEEDGLRLGEIAKRSGLSKQTMSSLVRAIEARGYVERRRDGSDGRAVRLFLSARARALEPIVETVLGQLDQLTSGLAAGGDIGSILDWLAALGAAGGLNGRTQEPERKAPALSNA